MSRKAISREGSFEALRDHHLFLFEGPVGVHLHQREAETAGRPGRNQSRPPSRPKWKTVGIFHYPADVAAT